MSTLANFTKKVLKTPELAQITFEVAVLDKYLAQDGTKVSRTRTVGRVKAATWAVDFGIAPDEKTLHVTLAQLIQKLPESEQAHWLDHAQGTHFSENYLKMQGSHACIDDGNLRAWGEPEEEGFF
ncbi:MAG: hypothetical protein KY445_00020 [Armatimonadetes bacterium]|nr:hypothetical protein [Armatimonadota bacterium]